MNNLQIKLENDRIFRCGHFLDMQSETVTETTLSPLQAPRAYRLSAHLIHADTISLVLRQEGKRCLALNFANAMFPGGAYILGGNAQEEALCRASLLYYTIRTQSQYYRRNRLHLLPDYTDTFILSRNVPIIRRNDGALLDTPICCDFLTAPAVNRRFAALMMSKTHLDAVMARRITGIVQLAATHSPDVIIFGAFGCGVFGNRREQVYPMFEEAIRQYVPDEIPVLFADPQTQ